MSESAPLLGNSSARAAYNRKLSSIKTRAIVWLSLVVIFVACLLLVAFQDRLPDSWAPWFGRLPKDPMLAALTVLASAPVIDGHVDLPILARVLYANNVSAIDLESPMPAHVDIPRIRQGKMGGLFWSVYVSCADSALEGPDFVNASWRVRDTLEQIDVAKLLIGKYPGIFQYATTSQDILNAVDQGKVASLLGVEGGHQLGNSLSVLRQYHALGVRYVTLTHTCHNAFADSCGLANGIEPLHHGLSSFGETLIAEMNRLGVFIDLSHTSDDTARQALNISKSPVIWSHSSARAVHNHPRNVPDDILELIGEGPGKTDAVVMVNFAPDFVAPPGLASVKAVADHIEHIANVAGKRHVGIGSDYDGIGSTPEGLEDVSKYPALFAELISRGNWTHRQLSDLSLGNLLRVMDGMEKTSESLKKQGAQPAFDIYEKRPDLPYPGRIEF